MRVLPILLLFGVLLGALPVSAEDVYVNPYYRSDGTYVQGHYRSAPDGQTWNNYGTRGSWQSPSTPYNQRDYDGDGLLNQFDYDDNNDGLND